MIDINRRDFLKSVGAILALHSVPINLAWSADNHELIAQLHIKEKEFFIIFLDLKTLTHKILPIPTLIHGILPIKNKTEFILTAKGGWIYHVTREKIISSRSSPENKAFFGHSSYDPNSNTLYTSGIDFKGFDLRPFRSPEPYFKDDETFGRGYIFEFNLDGLAPKGSFTSGGSLPHDQRLISQDELLVLNANFRAEHDGAVTYLDLKNKTVKKRVHFTKEEGMTPSSHMFGPSEKLLVVGITNEARVSFLEDGKLRKTQAVPDLTDKIRMNEMLNGAFDPSFSRACAMNIDNGFVGLWDVKTGKLLKHETMKFVVSVEHYQDHFLVLRHDSLNYYDYDLNLKKKISVKDLKLENKFFYGPHTGII